MKKISLNGEPKEIENGTTLQQVLESLNLATTKFGIAASVNGEIVERSNWETQPINENDSVDIIRAFQGG